MLILIRCNYTIHSFLPIFFCVFIIVSCPLATNEASPHHYHLLDINKKNVSAADQGRRKIQMHPQASK